MICFLSLFSHIKGIYCGRREVPFTVPYPQTNQVWVEYVNGEDEKQGRFVLAWEEIQDGPGKYQCAISTYFMCESNGFRYAAMFE